MSTEQASTPMEDEQLQLQPTTNVDECNVVAHQMLVLWMQKLIQLLVKVKAQF